MKSKVSYETIYSFLVASAKWLARDKANPQTKLGYAIQRVRPRAEKLWQKYQNGCEDIDIDHCAVDDKGLILRDEQGQYKFTKDGLKSRNKKRQELFESEIEIEGYTATDLPADLSEAERIAFAGFVLQESDTVPMLSGQGEPNTENAPVS